MYWNNGKENGNYYNGLYRDSRVYIGIMENRMETLTLEGSGSVKARKLQRVSASFAPAAGATAAPCHGSILENIMETTI